MQDETVSRALYDAMRMALKDIEAVLARHGCPPGATMTDWVDEQLTALAAATKPVDMVLLCPNCGMQHVDAVETGTALSRSGLDTLTETEVVTWSNPPHRSHMCHSCGHQWRPADVATNGVAELKTKGKNDSPRMVREVEPFAQCPHGDNAATCRMCARPTRPTPAQEKALDEMVADAQRLGLYDMPNPAAQQHAEPGAAERECRHCDWMCRPNDAPSKKWHPLDPDMTSAISEAAKTKQQGALTQDGRAVFINYGEGEQQMLDAASVACPACIGSGHHGDVTSAARDVLVERARQITAEGWTPTHDDEHDGQEMALAAIVYAESAVGYHNECPDTWPWSPRWFKPTTPRRDLVKAGALILAEIERIDRADTSTQQEGKK